MRGFLFVKQEVRTNLEHNNKDGFRPPFCLELATGHSDCAGGNLSQQKPRRLGHRGNRQRLAQLHARTVDVVNYFRISISIPHCT